MDSGTSFFWNAKGQGNTRCGVSDHFKMKMYSSVWTVVHHQTVKLERRVFRGFAYLLRSFEDVLGRAIVRIYGLYSLVVVSGTMSVSVKNKGVLSGKKWGRKKARIEDVHKKSRARIEK